MKGTQAHMWMSPACLRLLEGRVIDQLHRLLPRSSLLPASESAFQQVRRRADTRQGQAHTLGMVN